MKIRLSGVLLRYTDYRKEIEIQASTVNEALRELCRRYPAMDPILFTADGKLSRTHRLFVGDEPIDQNYSQPLQRADTLDIVTAIAGG